MKTIILAFLRIATPRLPGGSMSIDDPMYIAFEYPREELLVTREV